ncbi:MAG TPA: proline dehydrogenase family protein [candidate division Zixibacteria bacterium]|nr:proline dehydrogenase family protein [candidate division Zixibacteria bacterium]
MLRALFIGLSENKPLRSFAENSNIGKKVSQRFVAGMTLADLIRATETMNSLGIRVTADNLGENVTNRDEALHSRDLYHEMMAEIDKRKLDANVSCKLTHMGFDVDEQLARENVYGLVEHAASINNFLRIDMEGSPYTQKTIDLTRELHSKFPGHVGTVLQAYFYRTEDDAKLLCSEGIRIRLCKGAYKEPANLAFPEKHDVDANYVKVAKLLMKSGVFHGIATHDEKIIRELMTWSQQNGVKKSDFEFQMLHGVRRDLQEKLAKEGWGVRVYIPFGTEWYPYFMRRLAERPANVLFFGKQMLRG